MNKTIGENMQKNMQEKRIISINELPKEIPDFNTSFRQKDVLVKEWIINWIRGAISNNSIKENDIIPKKNILSNHLGVSVGTVQNAIRYAEDEGFLKSKQKVGTMISNMSNPLNSNKKSTTKRDKAVIAIKNYILINKLKVGKPLPAARKMAELLNITQNTARMAYEYLLFEDIIKSKDIRGNDTNWILNKYPADTDLKYYYENDLKSETLVDKLTDDLKEYFLTNYSIGDKIPSHKFLSKQLGVSEKTVHDCINNLTKDGILITRRGRYGTILAKNMKNNKTRNIENEIFAPAQTAMFYRYKKVESELINFIKVNYKAGDKLPSLVEFANKFNVSTNTVRKAFFNMARDGYITFARGRFGGTYLVDISDEDNTNESYQWIVINPQYIT